MILSLLLLVHSWYPQSCCGGRDCHPVPCEEISRAPDGDYVWNHVTFARAAVKLSEDEQCHVCVYDHALVGVCLFLAPRA